MHIKLEPAAGARVRVISDLHYGHVRSNAPSPQQLVAGMQGIDILIVAGDLAELRPGPWQAEGERLHLELQQACEQAGITLYHLAGNHDPEVPTMMLSLWQGRIVIIHGHALFDQVAPWGWEYLHHRKQVQRIIAQYPNRNSDLESRFELTRRMSSAIEPIYHSPSKCHCEILAKLLHCFWPPQRPLNIIGAWLSAPYRAERFAKSFAPQCDCLIFGHVHRNGRWRRGARQLITTGASFRNASPSYVDLCDSKIISYNKFDFDNYK